MKEILWGSGIESGFGNGGFLFCVRIMGLHVLYMHCIDRMGCGLGVGKEARLSCSAL